MNSADDDGGKLKAGDNDRASNSVNSECIAKIPSDPQNEANLLGILNAETQSDSIDTEDEIMLTDSTAMETSEISLPDTLPKVSEDIPRIPSPKSEELNKETDIVSNVPMVIPMGPQTPFSETSQASPSKRIKLDSFRPVDEVSSSLLNTIFQPFDDDFHDDEDMDEEYQDEVLNQNYCQELFAGFQDWNMPSLSLPPLNLQTPPALGFQVFCTIDNTDQEDESFGCCWKIESSVELCSQSPSRLHHEQRPDHYPNEEDDYEVEVCRNRPPPLLPATTISTSELLRDLNLQDPPPPSKEELQNQVLYEVKRELNLPEEDEDPADIRSRIRFYQGNSRDELKRAVVLHLFTVTRLMLLVDQHAPGTVWKYLDYCQHNEEYLNILDVDAIAMCTRLKNLTNHALFAQAQAVGRQESNSAFPPIQERLLPTSIVVNASEVCKSAELRKIRKVLESELQTTCLERELIENPLVFDFDGKSACIFASFPMPNCGLWASNTCKWLVFQGHAYTQLHLVLLLNQVKLDPSSRSAIRNLTSTLAMLNSTPLAPQTRIRFALSCDEAARQIRTALDEASQGNQEWYRQRDAFQECMDEDLQVQVRFLRQFPDVHSCVMAEGICLRETPASFLLRSHRNERLLSVLHAPLMPNVMLDEPQESEEKPVPAVYQDPLREYTEDGRVIKRLRVVRDDQGGRQTKLMWT